MLVLLERRASARGGLGSAGAGVDTLRAGAREIGSDDRGRHAVAAGRAEPGGEDRRLNPPGGVDGRPARVAVLDLSRDRRDRPRHRPVAQRVLRQHGRRQTDPTGRRPEPSVEWIADDRDGVAPPRAKTKPCRTSTSFRCAT